MKAIALIVDIKGWAFDIAANIIKQDLQDVFKIDIFYSKSEEFNDDLLSIIKKVKDYDIIHFFWRKTLLNFCDIDFQNKLIENNIDINILRQKISTGVYDHLFIDDPNFNEVFNNACKKYVTSSNKLYEIYCQNDNIKNPWGILGDTFDEKIFYPKNLERLKRNTNSPLVLGWAGNSEWNNKEKDENGQVIDFKGFHTILMPVINGLKDEGYDIELYFADKNTNYIPNDKMYEYYNKLDIYFCVSITEGTPKPILEAMGCGVPIITTDVGVVQEYMGVKQKHFIIGERKIGQEDNEIREQLKSKIIELYNNRELLLELSNENIENAKRFNSKVYKIKYKDYFLTF